MLKALVFVPLIFFNPGVWALKGPDRFLDWTLNNAKMCGVPTAILTMPHLYPCATEISAVTAFHTMFEGKPHTFGITACSDEHIIVGVRRTKSQRTLVYMEFLAFEDFLAFMKEFVHSGAKQLTNNTSTSHSLKQTSPRA
jgi:hypothetical protein